MPAPLVEFGEVLERRLRMQMMSSMVSGVVRGQEQLAEEPEMVVSGGGLACFRAAVPDLFLDVFMEQAMAGEIAGQNQGREIKLEQKSWQDRGQRSYAQKKEHLAVLLAGAGDHLRMVFQAGA